MRMSTGLEMMWRWCLMRRRRRRFVEKTCIGALAVDVVYLRDEAAWRNCWIQNVIQENG